MADVVGHINLVFAKIIPMSTQNSLPWLRRPLILASKSPRRHQLLRMAGIPFTVQTIDVEETYPDDLSVDEVAAYLADKKAQAARSLLQEDALLLTADSIVELEGEVFGKPRDYSDAVRILQRLSGNVHRVITGVCLLSAEKKSVFSGISRVHFAELSQAEIDYYLDTYEPYDKAGAYAIQEWIGLCKITKIEGTYSNIMGLPMELVYPALQEFQLAD